MTDTAVDRVLYLRRKWLGTKIRHPDWRARFEAYLEAQEALSAADKRKFNKRLIAETKL